MILKKRPWTLAGKLDQQSETPPPTSDPVPPPRNDGRVYRILEIDGAVNCVKLQVIDFSSRDICEVMRLRFWYVLKDSARVMYIKDYVAGALPFKLVSSIDNS